MDNNYRSHFQSSHEGKDGKDGRLSIDQMAVSLNGN